MLRPRRGCGIRLVVEFLVPLKWQVDDGARLGRVHQDIQGGAEDSALRLGVARKPRLMAEWIVDKDRAGRVNARGDVMCRRDHDCWDPRLLDDTCDQTNGLVVEWSGWDQDEGVNMVLYQLRYESRTGLIQHGTPSVDPAHEPAEESRA